MKEDKKISCKKWWGRIIVILIAVVLVSIPFIIKWAYLEGAADGLPNTCFAASDLLSFYGSFLAFLGTTALGWLALAQNKRFKEENDKAQTELKELNKQANDLSQKLLEIENINTIPYIRIFDFQCNPKLQEKPLARNASFIEKSTLGSDQHKRIYLIIENISNVGISFIEMNRLAVNENVFYDFQILNAGLNSQSLLLIALSFAGIDQLPKERNEEKNTIEFDFNFILHDFFGNKYQQNIHLKVDGLRIGDTTDRSSINRILSYRSEKPIKI